MKEDVTPIKYYKGVFDKFKNTGDLYQWIEDGFAETMWALGFDMDCHESFNDFTEKSPLKVKKYKTERERKRNILYYLEHAPRYIIGNLLFSEWRYWTHWSMCGYTEYEVDFLHRIIKILEESYDKYPVSVNDYVKAIKFPPMEYLTESDGNRYYIQKYSEEEQEEDTGIPSIIEERIDTNSFEICNSDMYFEVMDIIKEQKNGED